ncbi:heparin lyase I family protein [Streptomyces sp. NPDC058667]|uniref:heparin lyase I family protein n=1 Tax=Streptomyces sp. NPDC058667 TaxID=3346588 RepID=UPI0036548217
MDAGSHRFSFANYLPGDWQKQDFDTIVAQWSSTQDDTPRIKPVMALAVHGGDRRLKVHWMSDGRVQERIIPLGAARPGHWNQWTFDITWSSPNTPGAIAVARDRVKVGSHQGANNYHRGQPPHFRIGAYRPGWRPEKGPRLRAGASEAVLFIDDIAITSTVTGSAPAPPPPGDRRCGFSLTYRGAFGRLHRHRLTLLVLLAEGRRGDDRRPALLVPVDERRRGTDQRHPVSGGGRGRTTPLPVRLPRRRRPTDRPCRTPAPRA